MTSMQPVLTTGEDQRAGMGIHWEVLQLEEALSFNGQPGEEMEMGNTSLTAAAEAQLTLYEHQYFWSLFGAF